MIEDAALSYYYPAVELSVILCLKRPSVDVVEVALAYGVSEITALAAATVVWEYPAFSEDRGEQKRQIHQNTDIRKRIHLRGRQLDLQTNDPDQH